MPEMEIRLVIGGHELRPNDDWARVFDSEVIEWLKRQFRELFGPVRCPIHNESPRSITMSGDTIETFTLGPVEACCDELVAALRERLSSAASQND